jgi:hypothetical protein
MKSKIMELSIFELWTSLVKITSKFIVSNLYISHSNASMTYHMNHFSEIESLSPSLQFLAFSEAYLESAGRLCDALAASPAESNYPKGAVVLSLAFHGIELFLKAAILKKSSKEKLSGNIGHDLDHLSNRYANLYPGKKYKFEIPFRNEEINLDPEDPLIVDELIPLMTKHKRATPTDQLHRYPRNTEGKPWEGIFAFEASSFAIDIANVQRDIARLKELIFRD